MTYDSCDSTPDIREDIQVLMETDCPFVLYTSIFIFGIIPFCTVLYLTTHQHKASIRGFEYYRQAQMELLVALLCADLTSIDILASCISKQVPFKLPIIAAVVPLVPYVCGCMLLHHIKFIPFPRQYPWHRYLLPEVVLEQLLYNRRRQETDWEEWGSQDTTLCGDEWDDEQIDHGGDTEPLLREWLAEQQRLSQIDDGDTDDGAELTFSTSSTLNPEMDFWFSYSESGYDSDDASLAAVADSFLLPGSISD